MANKYLRAVSRLSKGHTPVYIEYPILFQPRWRGSLGHPVLSEIISRQEGVMQTNLGELAALGPVVQAIEDGRYPELARIDWRNRLMPALDASTLMWAALRAPRTYMEIGSGFSTLFVRAALKQQQSKTRIVSIDPAPRADCDAACDEVIRASIETCDLTQFERLEAGDALFIDNSHRSFMNSDVTVCMLEILPRLKPGVLVGLHDIFLPFDYPADWSGRGYNEQYLLASYLLANPDYFKIQFANRWLFERRLHHEPLAEVWSVLGDGVRDRAPSAFWGVKA
jgi:predicted O-methyltransferase YrrM